MTRTAVANDKGIDYSGLRVDPRLTAKAGGRFIVRYSAGVGNSAPNAQWKLCGPTEIRDAVAAGMDFVANSEWYESRITEGAAAGRADGASDLAFWRSRGLARGASVICSWDAYPNRSQWVAAASYLMGHNASMGGYYFTDCYGGTQFLKYALGKKIIRYGWRPNAGSWSNDNLPYQPAVTPALLAKARAATPAAIWQTGNYWWNQGADENVLLRPVGSHLSALAATAAAARAAQAAKTAAAKPAPRPAAKPSAPKPFYLQPGPPANSIISADRQWGIYVTDDGRAAVCHHGQHIRYL